MSESKGSYGKVSVFEDFLGFKTATMGTTALPIGSEGVMYCSVEEGSFATDVSASSGVVRVTTDTASGDNCAMYIGPIKPTNGNAVMEARVRGGTVSLNAMFVGFTETLDATTPVMPAEISASTMKYNGSGGMAGMVFDADGTSNEWLAVAGDAGVVATKADANGKSYAYSVPTTDSWDTIRVEIDREGKATMLVARKATGTGFDVVDEVASAVNPSDNFYAAVVFENRVAAACTFEADYMYARGFRDWATS